MTLGPFLRIVPIRKPGIIADGLEYCPEVRGFSVPRYDDLRGFLALEGRFAAGFFSPLALFFAGDFAFVEPLLDELDLEFDEALRRAATFLTGALPEPSSTALAAGAVVVRAAS